MKVVSKSGRFCELTLEGNRIKRVVGYHNDSGTTTYITVDKVDEVLETELNLLSYEKTLQLSDDVRPFIQTELLEGEYRNFTSKGIQPSLIRVID